jgi:hypothetical protein
MQSGSRLHQQHHPTTDQQHHIDNIKAVAARLQAKEKAPQGLSSLVDFLGVFQGMEVLQILAIVAMVTCRYTATSLAHHPGPVAGIGPIHRTVVSLQRCTLHGELSYME